jgi:dipeptidyl aminopeptidase/acylaminoacyl peptidase
MTTPSIRIFGRLCLLACLAGCTAPADHPALKDAALPPLIQAHRFAYRGDASGGYRLSPDGSKLAWIGPWLMRSTLFVRDNATGELRKYWGRSADFRWTPDSRRLLYTKDTSETENTHVYMIDLADAAADAVDLTPYPGVKAGIHQIVAGDPDHVLVYHNRRDRKLRDLYRIDLNTRSETLVGKNPGDAVSPVTARDGSLQRWQTSREAQRPAEERHQPLAVRRPVLLKKPDETFRVLGASADGSFVWALSNRGRDRVALVVAHPTLGWERVVFEDPQVDVDRVTMSRVTGAPLIATAQPGYPRVEFLDPALRDDLKALLDVQGGGPFGLEIVSTDDTEKHLIVAIYTSAQRRDYLVDRSSRSYTLLARSVAQDLADALAPVQPVKIASRDGLQLHGYLTLPRGVEPKRLPMVLLVHGGPWMRTGWGGSEDADNAQFLANRGYAVLQVDFRGSTGYGHRFLTAGIGEFAGKMHEDLLDAVRWAVDGGIADPSRVAIMGWSYGGYAALAGLTMTPEVFACGVSLAGPTDLATLIEAFPPYWTVDLSMWHDYVGNPGIAEDRREMTLRSPLSHAQMLQRPTLIVHGAKDVRVRLDQAERMVDALRRAGKPVEYLAIEDMGHGMGWWVHRLAVLRRTEDFLQRCIGGRASRFDPFDAVSWVWTRITR